MALGAVLAAALTDHSVRVASLTIGGLDVLYQPGNTTSKFGVTPDNISMTWEGPGGVSALSFVIDDPLKVISIQYGAEVLFRSIEDNDEIFLGFVTLWDQAPAFGDTGISWTVQCIGIECLLDWTIVEGQTVNAGVTLQNAILQVASTFPGRAFGSPTSRRGDQAGPVGDFNGRAMTNAVVIAAGTTLRNAIEILAQNASDLGGVTGERAVLATVDFTKGLRAWQGVEIGLISGPNDYAIVGYSGVGTSLPIADLQFTTDIGAVVRRVYIVGANAAGSGWVSDGSGILGPAAVLNDSTSDTADKRNQIGAAYLDSFAPSLRGRFYSERGVSGTGASAWDTRPGAQLQLTQTTLGLTGYITRTMTIEREWVTWDWSRLTITFGALAPRATRLTRKLTRGTLA